MVLLPEPDGPTIAVDVPDLILKLAPLKMSLAPAGAVGYRKCTSLNLIPSWISIDFFADASSVVLISGYLSITFTTCLAVRRAFTTAGMIPRMLMMVNMPNSMDW